MSRWNFDVVFLGALLAIGFLRWHRHASEGRTGSAAMAAALLLFLYVSPFCALGSALFAARAAHHAVLMIALAPLLVGAFGDRCWRTRLSLPALTVLQTVILWLWHAPPFYSAALSSDAVFWAMQISITLSATFWWAKIRNSEPLQAIASSLATMVQMGVLGALLVFTGRTLYAPHAATTQAWGMSALEDQQIAGLIMWAPASAAYLFVAAWILHRFLGREVAA